MKILVEPSGYRCLNMGDVAMLQVTVKRLQALWSGADIQVFTDAPDLLTGYCPGVTTVRADSRRAFFAKNFIFGGLHNFIPHPLSSGLRRIESGLRYRLPRLAEAAIETKRKMRNGGPKGAPAFIKTLMETDLVVVSGAGSLNDSFQSHASSVLDTLALAIKFGKVTAMLGQGIGPIVNDQLLLKAKAVLPYVDFIAVRERRTTVPLLTALDVPQHKIMVTGDDAIELAYTNKLETMGSGIGVNLRVASYSKISEGMVEGIRSILAEVSSKYDALLVPVPISRHENGSDVKTIRLLLGDDYSGVDRGESLDTPAKVIENLRHCRIVVTGSYHAAVFALARGIPAVCVANSDYYAAKFLGLAEQFGHGCEVIPWGAKTFRRNLRIGIKRAWDLAESVRPGLRQAAARQIEQSRHAYQYVYRLVSGQQSRVGLQV